MPPQHDPENKDCPRNIVKQVIMYRSEADCPCTCEKQQQSPQEQEKQQLADDRNAGVEGLPPQEKHIVCLGSSSGCNSKENGCTAHPPQEIPKNAILNHATPPQEATWESRFNDRFDIASVAEEDFESAFYQHIKDFISEEISLAVAEERIKNCETISLYALKTKDVATLDLLEQIQRHILTFPTLKKF